ncbi:hypothetical protein INR49_007114 [Caranx melampygus]|nr:hypothetical protein INR49_007114 [Caranx melampygus]
MTVEEVMTTTAYLDLFLRSISEPALLQTFLSFILLHTHDNVHILDTLVSRVNTPFQLGTVSLALFRTLIGLFCEDVMLQLVFRSVSDSLQPPEQEAAFLLKAERLLLLQRRLLPAPHALMVPVYLHNTNTHSQSEHIHWPKGADLAVSDSVGYCRGSDFLMDVNYLHYLWDARQAIATSQRAPCFTQGGAESMEDEDEIVQRVKSDSICSLVTTPPPSALSPTPSSSDTISTGNLAGRASSALELEWDDIFEDDDPSSSGLTNMGLANGSVTAPPPLPPQHIQEMRRNAIKLVHGSYVEESEFQDDVLVYDLVAQKDTKAAILERIMAANRRARGSSSNGQRVSMGMSITSMLTMTGRTVMETVNSIMSTRRSEDGGKEERRSEDYGKEVRSEYCGKETGRKKEEEEGEKHWMDVQAEVKGLQGFFNGFNGKNHIIDECDDAEEDGQVIQKSFNLSDLTTQSHKEGRLPVPIPRTHALFGVEPDCDDITDNIGSFRRRVRALRQKLEEEEDKLYDKFDISSSWDDGEEEGEEEAMEEEDEVEEGEELRSSSKKGSSRHGIPFTGPFISVLLSRLENLLENSIAVNLLVTGILAQLASYPQPLLRSFLLNTDTTHNQPNVRTLYQVLLSVHAQIERYVADRPDYPTLVTQAWRFLLAKDQDSKFRECLESQHGNIILDPSLPNGSVRNALALPPPGVLPPCPPIPPQAKSRVFAIVLYAEFLKELAAIAQEHSIALDCSAEE